MLVLFRTHDLCLLQDMQSLFRFALRMSNKLDRMYFLTESLPTSQLRAVMVKS